mmetsp:Transcript_8262/g.12321  ORF Transcript_8262/g.12321 Transcript_8262/m.12321 type:complete len:269 (-) Transcript_8262:577-1383(-)
MMSCKFFKENRCRNGWSCRFSHDDNSLELSKSTFYEPQKMNSNLQPSAPISCKFFDAGLCRFGSSCRYLHSVDISKVIETNNDTNVKGEEVKKCGICMEDIEKFGLLSACDHTFCNTCITSWRLEALRTASKEEKDTKRSCPLCREHSDFVIASYFYYCGEEKQEFISAELSRRSSVPCREHQLGKTCKFGGHCFYAHLDASGKDMKEQQLKEQKELHAKKKRISRQQSEDYEFLLRALMAMDIDEYQDDRFDFFDDDDEDDDESDYY